MEENKQRSVRVVGAIRRKAADEEAVRKVARFVLAVTARQLEREAEEQTQEEGDER